MFLPHIDVMPLVYGLVIFLGLLSMWFKLVRGNFIGLLIEVSVFTLVFKLHGGSMAGGFAAAIAALLAGLVFPRMISK
jgi:hypothetical protein